MTLTEILDQVLLESGQFLFETNLEIDEVRFRKLVEYVLNVYSRYMPVERTFNINVSNLTYDFTNHEYGIPDWISKVVMVSIPYNQIYRDVFAFENEFLRLPKEAPYTYRKPVLYVSLAGDYDVTAVYKHKLEHDEEQGYYYIDTIDYSDHLFFKLLTGKFLQALGRSRRAFTLNDLPITNDASELVSEGRELEQEAMEELGENGKWYLAWGG